MSPVFGREALEAMKRTDIQRLCKDYGVKANLKTEALIDLLLDASRPQPPRHNPSRPPPRPPSTRIPSLAGTRPRGQSTGSIIIHGSEGEGEPMISQRHIGIKSHEAGPQRTRKAKQTQYRLGVGRPVIAGGSGARAITKSIDISSRTLKRAKSSKSIKPSEMAIVEEPELNGSIDTSHSNGNVERTGGQIQRDAHPSSKIVDNLIAEALVPVQQELTSHKMQLTDLKEKVSSLIESFNAKIRDLTLEIQGLRAQARNSSSDDTSMTTVREHSVRLPEPPSTPKRVRTPHLPFTLPATGDPGPPDSSNVPFNDDADPSSADIAEQPKQIGPLLPGFPHSILGKRPRDSSPSNASGALEPIQKGTETGLEINANAPLHKRAKLCEQDKSTGVLSAPEPLESEFCDAPQDFGRAGGSSFPVFAGREEELLPPVDRPANFFGPTSPPLRSVPATSCASNIDNQNPFSFTFMPVASTPAQAVYPLAMGTFPHPEPPTSPSPAANPDRPGSRHSDRLAAFGVPRSSSRASGRAASGGSLTRGEAGGSSGLQRVPSSNEIASGLGLTAIKTSATEQGTAAPPAKRTMYGTELDGDTRFGDFGVEGVASGFWAGGRF